MSIASEVKVGTIVIVKVGRNMVEAIVTGITETGVKVKSRSSGREFETRRIERIVAAPETEAATQAEPEAPETETAAPGEPKTEAPETDTATTAEPEAPETEAAAPTESETEAVVPTEPEVPETEAAAPTEPEAPETEAPVTEEDHAVNPAPESGDGPRPAKKLSLLSAAAQVLATCRTPLNCKEMVAKAIEMGLWVHTGAKTPEQTLYGGIFREIKTCEEPRFKKSETRKGSFEYAKEQ